MRALSLAQWLARQETVHPRGVDLGLERVSSVARTLGVIQPAPKVITVGGTNGKGSTVAFLEAILCAHGVAVGAFTSPHLIRYNERIRIQGEEVTDAELVSAFERIEAARGATTLTFFEYSTLAALCIFKGRQVEVALLEVGLGGRLDATNLVDADVAIVCSIGFDHRDWLGDTLEKIGAEKAGIVRAERPVVLGTEDMPASIFSVIEQLGARALVAERDFCWMHAPGAHAWRYHGLQCVFENLPQPALDGKIQYRNAATALAALEVLECPQPLRFAAVSQALRDVRLPGRFQIVPGTVEWIFDVAHNAPAAQVLAENLRARPCLGRTLAVTSILRDKDAAAIAAALKDVVDCWILCSLDEPRGSTAQELAQRLGAVAREAMLADSVAAGCELARQEARPGDRVVVFGSFLTVGPALAAMHP